MGKSYHKVGKRCRGDTPLPHGFLPEKPLNPPSCSPCGKKEGTARASRQGGLYRDCRVIIAL